MSLARFMLVWTLLILSAAGTPAQTMDILASVQIYSGAKANGPANLVSNLHHPRRKPQDNDR